MASVCSDRMMQSSSPSLAVCGSSSLIQAPVFGVLAEFEDRIGDGKLLLAGGHPRESLPVADGIGEILPTKFFQARLVIEHVELRWPAGLKQEDDPLCLGGKIREAGKAEWFGARRERRRGNQRGALCRFAEQRTERGKADAGARAQRNVRRFMASCKRSIDRGVTFFMDTFFRSSTKQLLCARHAKLVSRDAKRIAFHWISKGNWAIRDSNP